LIAITVSAGVVVYSVYYRMVGRTAGIELQIESVEAVKAPSSTVILVKVRNVGSKDLSSVTVSVSGDVGTAVKDLGALPVGAVKEVTILNPAGFSVTPGGTYPVKVSMVAADGSSAEKSCYVRCQGVAAPSGGEEAFFSLSVSPETLIVEPGGSESARVDVSSKAGYTKTVELTVVNVPADLTATLNPTVGAPSFSSTLTVEANAHATGKYSFKVRATGSDGVVREKDVTVQIPLNPPENPPGDIPFNITVHPNPVTVDAGGTAAALASVTGFSSVNVRLSLNGVPSDLTVTLEPWSGTTPFTSVLTVKASAKAKGQYFFNVRGVDDEGNANSCPVVVVVSGAEGGEPGGWEEKAKSVALNDTRVQEQVAGKDYEIVYGTIVALSASPAPAPADKTLSFAFKDGSPPLIVTVDLDAEQVVDVFRLPAKAGVGGNTGGTPGSGAAGLFWSGVINQEGDYELVYIGVSNTTKALRVGLLWSSSSNDIDLYLYNPDRQPAAQSTAVATLHEGVSVSNPAVGTWLAVVYGCSVPYAQGYYGAVDAS